MNRIKRLSMEVLKDHKEKFGTDFNENKQALNSISIIRSKVLKNELAGYITKFIKMELKMEKIKRGENNKEISEEQNNKEISEEQNNLVDPKLDTTPKNSPTTEDS